MGTERTRERTKAEPASDRSPAAAPKESAQGAADRPRSPAPEGARAPRQRRTTVAVLRHSL
jgi:hypothetical protein